MSEVLDELHLFRDGDELHALHVATSAIYALDHAAADAVERLRARGDARLDPELAAELRRLGLLVPAGAPARPLLDPWRPDDTLSTLVLHVSHRCNLACSYCYAGGGSYGGPAEDMTPEVGRELLRWFFGQAAPGAPLSITFFGGEPLLNLPLMHELADDARHRAAAGGHELRFGVTTNGTLVTPAAAALLGDLGAQVTVSVDGAGDDHEALRPGSLARIRAALPLLREHCRVVARVTVTRRNLDIERTVHELLGWGFAEVGVTPADTPDPELRLREADLRGLLAALERLAERFVADAEQGRLFGLTNLLTTLRAVEAGRGRDLPCGAGVRLLAASPRGELSLCHRLVGDPAYGLSAVPAGPDPERRRELLAGLRLESRPGCGGCWARYLCGGGCHHARASAGTGRTRPRGAPGCAAGSTCPCVPTPPCGAAPRISPRGC